MWRDPARPAPRRSADRCGCARCQWSADNVAFGSGGALLQKMHRDVHKIAMKCSYARIYGHGVDVYKDPITDPGKKSKRGRLTLEHNAATGAWATVCEGKGDPSLDTLVTVFEDGAVVREWTLAEIRERAETPEVLQARRPG